MSYAQAEEPVVQTSEQPAPTESATPIATIETVQATVAAAETTLSTAVSTADPASVSASQPEITEAQTAIEAANTAVAVAETATENVVTATEVKETATTELATAQTAVTEATTAVTTQQAVVTTETAELTALQNTPSDSNTYTTEGYVAPVAPETPTITTTTLPAMWDAATKIETPFDIKMGDTVYEGQGTDSQIYVTSKATITFGTGDYNWWDFPAGPNISVYGSDFMSAGTGASITVTTTETTLAVDWDLHKFGDSNGPITNVNWTMTVNPETGEWTGVGTVAGNTSNLYNGPRIGVRETAGGPVEAMTPVTNETLTQQIANQQTVVTAETTELTALQETKTNAEADVEVKTEAVVEATTALNTAVTTAEVTLATANSLANTAVEKVATAVQALETNTPIPAPPPPPTPIPDPEPQPSPEPPTNPVPPPTTTVDPLPEPPSDPVEPETVPELPEPVEPPSEVETPTPEPDPVPEPDTSSDVPADATDNEDDTSSTETPIEEPETPTEPQPPVEEPSAPPVEPEAPPAEPEQPVEEPQAPETPEPEPQNPIEEPSQPPINEEPTVAETVKDAMADGKLTTEEKAAVADALIASVAPGEAVTADAIKEAGLEYKDLPPATPVEVRQDENGNEVIITADVAAALVLLENPSELIGAIFSDPGQALHALGSIGADMSPQEREEAEKMVVAAVIAGNAAINAVAVAGASSSTTTGGSTGGGGGSGGGGASGDNKGVRRRRP